VPVGVAGELYIGGDGLARGYLHRANLTAEKFVVDPFSDRPDVRLYRTGDLVRYLPDGNLQFVGRLDHQVKVRGFRIELGEIEAVLERHPTVQSAVVAAREEVPGGTQLIGYMVLRQGEEKPSTTKLRSYLQEHLPSYMVPSFLMFLDAFPLTPNRKVDRGRLPAPDGEADRSSRQYAPPTTATEAALVELWQSVLAIDKIGIYDDFFELGVHSLLAIRLVYRLENLFGISFPLRKLFQYSNIASLAEAIEEILIEQVEQMGEPDVFPE
jgi:acyl carrier protein